MHANQELSQKLAFSIDEVQAIVGLGKTSLYKLIGSGRLKTKKVNRRSLILKEDLEAFLSGLEDYPVKHEGGHG